MSARITPADLAAWRRALVEEGDGEHLDPTTAQLIASRLMTEVEQLWTELAGARKGFAEKAAGALEKRLDAVRAFGECETCRNAEAHAFLVKLKRIAEG